MCFLLFSLCGHCLLCIGSATEECRHKESRGKTHLSLALFLGEKIHAIFGQRVCLILFLLNFSFSCFSFLTCVIVYVIVRTWQIFIQRQYCSNCYCHTYLSFENKKIHIRNLFKYKLQKSSERVVLYADPKHLRVSKQFFLKLYCLFFVAPADRLSKLEKKCKMLRKEQWHYHASFSYT